MATVETIPALAALEELKRGKQWVCFDKDKIPYTPGTGKRAKADVAATWGTYQQAVARHRREPGTFLGVGREFLASDGLVGIDLDYCIVDGQLSERAQALLSRFNSYAEYSPSGQGVHIWVRGSIPDNVAPDKPTPDGIEIYFRGRYFTVTGNHVAGTPTTIEQRDEELAAFYSEVRAARKARKDAERERKQAAAAKSHNLAKKDEQRAPGDDHPYCLAALRDECELLGNTQKGSRNDQLNLAAFRIGRYVGGRDLSRATAERELLAACDRNGLTHDEPVQTESSLKGGLEAGMLSPRTAPLREPEYRPQIHDTESDQGNGNGHSNGNGKTPPPPLPPTLMGVSPEFILECLGQAEWGDALLFAKLFSGKAVYDHTEESWYVWQGHYWLRDDTGKIKHFVSGQLASIYLAVGAYLIAQPAADQEKLQKLVKALANRALELRHVSRCKNVLTFASSMDGLGITSKRWDINKWLLAFPNGVVDLRTGLFRDGQPEDYIRTICPTRWQGLQAPAPRFERFLEEIFADRAPSDRTELIAFLQRMLGYGVTGEVREHIFSVFYGEDGRNGKDTLEHALSNALGETSGVISKDVFLDASKSRNAGAATPHLSDLQGKRLAWANEPEKGSRFSTGQVKELSGGGAISTRGNYEKRFYTFQPTHLLLLLTNHKPHADANDAAFWTRLRLITFNMRFVDKPTPGTNERAKDEKLWQTLEDEAAGIVAWLVRGALEWQQQGLATPDQVIRDAQIYRQEEDTLGLFLSECCTTTNPNAQVSAKAIYTAYGEWCVAGKQRIMNSTQFGKQLAKRHHKETTYKGVVYFGIGLLDTSAMGNYTSFEVATPQPVAPAEPLPIVQQALDTSDERVSAPAATPAVQTEDNKELALRQARGRILAQNTRQVGESREAYDKRIEGLLKAFKDGNREEFEL